MWCVVPVENNGTTYLRIPAPLARRLKARTKATKRAPCFRVELVENEGRLEIHYRLET